MSAAQLSSRLQAAAAAQLAEAAAVREEELSDAASLPEHATAQLNAEAAAEMWSSSSESSGAPVRRGMRRAKYELRHGVWLTSPRKQQFREALGVPASWAALLA